MANVLPDSFQLLFLVLPSALLIFHEIYFWSFPSISSFSVFLRPTQVFLTPLLNIFVSCGLLASLDLAGSAGNFFAELELIRSVKIRPLRLRKRYKFNNIIKREMNGTDSHQSCHVCDVWGWGRNILPGPTQIFYLSRNWSRPKIFRLCIPVFMVSTTQE